MSPTQNPKWRPGKKRPATSAFLIQGPPLRNFTKESLEKPKPSARPADSSTHLQRVQHSRFFGASPVASALDLRLERDPEANGSTLSRPACPHDAHLRLAVTSRGGVKQPCPGSVPLAGFQLTRYGRFCSDHRGFLMVSRVVPKNHRHI